MSRTARPTARPLLALLLGLLLAVSTVVVPAPAHASTADVEQRFLELLNAERRTAGLRALGVESQLVGVARDWSAKMSRDGQLSHRPDLSSVVTLSWRRLGENVGVGPSVQRVHDAFMASPGHRANVLGDYDRVGIGVVHRDGRIWVTVNFMLSNGSSSSTTSPSSSIFRDIAGNAHQTNIEKLYRRGTTTGCARDLYCPSQAVTRGQMATFLARELDLPSRSASFSDVPSRHAHAGSIGALAAAGITSGCGGGRFCPDDTVTRAQMATFLTRAMSLPEADPRNLRDVPRSHPHARSIGALQRADITQGCGSGVFCPEGQVSRAQMASFLTRAFG